eukprot:COSAG06_NODE_35846_length_454_cov_143.532394_1_plen_151_part_11
MIDISTGMMVRWYEHASRSCGTEELLSGGAIGILQAFAAWESPPKVAPESRGPLEAAVARGHKQVFSTMGKVLTVQRVEEVCDAMMKADMLGHEDISFVCGFYCLIWPALYQHSGASAHATVRRLLVSTRHAYQHHRTPLHRQCHRVDCRA